MANFTRAQRSNYVMFKPEKLEEVVKPSELARVLARASRTADPKVMHETEFQIAEQQPDDAAVDRFAAAMKAKLNKKRQEGRGGWQTMTAEQLSALLHEHVCKCDPVDVANLAMMLHQNGQRIEQQPAPDMTPWEELDFSKMTRRQLAVYSGQQNFKITHLQARNEHLNAKVRRQKDALRQIERKPTPDVSALVEALEGIMRVEARDRVMPVGAEWDAARAALASYHKGAKP